MVEVHCMKRHSLNQVLFCLDPTRQAPYPDQHYAIIYAGHFDMHTGCVNNADTMLTVLRLPNLHLHMMPVARY